MPIKLNHLKDQRVPLTIPLDDGEEINIEYNPHFLKLGQRRRFFEAVNSDDDMEAARIFCEVVKAWDVVDDKGQKVPINEKTVADCSAMIMLNIMTRCFREMFPNQMSLDNSG